MGRLNTENRGYPSISLRFGIAGHAMSFSRLRTDQALWEIERGHHEVFPSQEGLRC